MARHSHIRTYSGRARLSALTLERLATLGPARSLPEGPLNPAAVFGRVAPLVLEVGCGHGSAAIAYAVAHPWHDVVAVDVHPPGIARALAAAEAAAVPSLRIELADAVPFLEGRVGPAMLDAVHLFFPDPWPKRKHAKRRFVSARTLDVLGARVKPSGHVLVATDEPRYAEHVERQVRRHGAFTVARTARPTWRPTAGFEAKAIAAGRPVTELRLALEKPRTPAGS